MKLLLKILLSLVPFSALAQLPHINYYFIDQRAIQVKVAEPEILAVALTSPYKTEQEKVRSIFRWITENISYKIGRTPIRNTFTEQLDDDTSPLKPLDLRVSELVLSRKEAVCDGYARLFKTLCNYAGIRAEVILGYADNRMVSKFRTNHRWNAVMIDSSWYLLDVTWAAGYTNYSGDRFIKDLDEKYFLSRPEDFINDHYPEELQWTLLPNVPHRREYNRSPYATSSFARNKITGFKPSSGIIEASIGDTLNFEVETDNWNKTLFVMDTAIVDSIQISNVLNSMANVAKPINKKATCDYVVTSENREWLSVVLNDEVVMRYRLNVRKNFTAKNE